MTEAGSHWVIVNCTGETLTESASGGIATWVLGTVRAAARHGVQVPVVTKRHPGIGSAWPQATEVTYPRPGWRGSARLDLLLRTRQEYVHPWQPWWNRRVVAALKTVAPEPCNVLLHNDPELATVVAESLPDHTVWHLLHNTNPMGGRWRDRFVEGVRSLAVSHFVGRWWEAQLGLPGGSVRTVYAGVDSTAFSPGPKPQPPVVSFVGLFNERKAPDTLLAACELVVARDPQLRFSVLLAGATHYGPDEHDAYSSALSAGADRLRTQGIDVVLPGFLPRGELAAALSTSSVNVVPSRWEEPFSLAALEGMAAGAATVVTDRGGLPEAAGGAAIVVPSDDASALATALAGLLGDTAALTDLGERGRRRATAMSWDRTWRELAGIGAVPTRP